MIHYHGLPFSGQADVLIKAMAGKHAFVSFSSLGCLPIAAEICQSVALDNGAFTAWKTGDKYNINAYAAWIEKWHRHPCVDWYVMPDVIAGTTHDNMLMRCEWRNVCPDGAWGKGVPVWHLHDDLHELNYLCHAYQRIALGSSEQYQNVGSKLWWARMADAMAVACDDEGNPRVKLHGFRMLDPTIFSHLPFSSADSTNVARNIGIDQKWKGTYTPVTKESRALIMMERVEAHCSASRWNKEAAGVQQNMELFG